MREVIARYGEERFALQIAKAIDARRAQRPVSTTGELAELVAGAVRTREKGQHPATRTFQALRIFINRELEELPHALAAALNLLTVGGRLAVISFHSLEDRMVKQFIAAGANPGAAMARLPLRESELPQPVVTAVRRVLPTDEEVESNPRARSAVLRVAERTATPLSAAGGEEFLRDVARVVLGAGSGQSSSSRRPAKPARAGRR
jgi:16S rRNA (cytosine1402-N4)-methyltransferase